jgi:hypothetical protein
MNAKLDIERFKKEFVLLKNATNEEKAEFDARFKYFIASKSPEEKKELAKAFSDSAKEEVERAKKLIDFIDVRLKLEKVLDIVSMAYISETYFHKSRSWFNQRLNNSKVNGVPASFTAEELKTLSNALDNIGSIIKKTARSIAC